MREQLIELARLQEIDDQLAMLERSKGDYPQRIDELQSELKTRLQLHQGMEEEEKDLQKEQRRLERLVKDHQSRIAILQDRLGAVKTNKEWDALQKEMDAAKSDLSEEEDQLLEVMEKIEGAGDVPEIDDEELDDFKPRAETEIKDLKVKLSGVDSKMAKIRSERDALTVHLDDGLKRIYNRVKEGKQGTAVVPVVRGACGGCYNRIPPQTITEIRRAERPITCENCGRIMLWFGEDDES
ncbi:zinc ribbon domain-containing protein [Gemmatimonadota bacterium]